MSNSQKDNLLDYGPRELETLFDSLGEPRFRAQQLFKWIHQFYVDDFDAMTNISKALRARLADIAEIKPPTIVSEHASGDGTIKWVLALDDGQCIETVFIPESDRGTLCISSQVGCALDCTFCSTARQGFNRNLSVGEIVGQLWLAKRMLEKDPKNTRVVSNVVLMGMGEPLLNYDNVIQALQTMLDDNGYGLSKRRVTLSTSGVIPALDRLSKTLDIALAVSLHAPNDALRDKLVPLNRKYPIAELMAACRRFLENKAQRERITMEYVMLEGINDQPEHARELIRLLRDVPSKVNLIPFNPFPETRYKRSSALAIDRFRRILEDKGLVAITRRTRGDDVDAACGQLAGQVNDRSRRDVHFSRIEKVAR